MLTNIDQMAFLPKQLFSKKCAKNQISQMQPLAMVTGQPLAMVTILVNNLSKPLD